MGNRFTPITGYDITTDWDAVVISKGGRIEGTGIFPLAAEKRAPNDLSEYINHSDIPAGSTIMVVDEEQNGILYQITNRFFLTGFNINYREKAQLVETFGASTVSFFGNTIKVYQFSGSAVDYPSEGSPESSMNQTSLLKLYDEHLRGTKLLKNKRIGVIKIFNHTVYGYPLSFNSSYNSSQDKLANFTMSWVVARHDFTIPGLIDDEDLANSYNPKEVLIQNEETKARLNRIQEFLEAYEENLTYTPNLSYIGSSSELTAADKNKTNLANTLAPLSSVSGETIKQSLEFVLFSDSSEGSDIYTTLEEKFSPMLDFLISLHGRGELPPRFGIADLKDVKALLSGLDNTENLKYLAFFSKALVDYVAQIRKAERILTQDR